MPDPNSTRTPCLQRRAVLGGIVGAALVGCHRDKKPPHQRPRFADGLSFLPDDPRELAASGVDAFICDVSAVNVVTDKTGEKHFYRTFEACDGGIDEGNKYVQQNSRWVRRILDGAELLRRGAPAAVFQFQSCEPIGANLARMSYFHRKGLRVLQLTHNESNLFATSYLEESSGIGLSNLGRDGLSEMNRVGLVADLSHASEATTLEAARLSKRPVILSHAGCRALLPNPRNASDRMIQAVADSGGVFGIFMMSFWLTNTPNPTAADYVAHVKHALNVAGSDAVGIANDYSMSGLQVNGQPFDNKRDTAEYWHPFWDLQRRKKVKGFEGPSPQHGVIPELNTIHRLERIYEAMKAAGLRSSDIDKVMGMNWIRFLSENIR